MDSEDALRARLDTDPTDGGALSELVTRFNRTGRQEELVALVEERESVLLDRQLAVRLLLRAAHCCLGELSDPARGAGLLGRVLVDDDTHAEALSLLGGAYARTANHPGLAEIRRRQIALCAEVAERITLLLDLSNLQAQGLADPNLAIETLQQVLELDPSHRVALERLEVLLAGVQRWTDLLTLLQTQCALAETNLLRVELLARQAAVLEHRLSDHTAAAEAYRQALELCEGVPALARQQAALAKALAAVEAA